MTGDVEGFAVALGIELRGWGSSRNRAFSCLNDAAHERGDQRPSAHVNVDTGAWRCKSCGESGGAYDLALLAGKQPREAMDLLRECGFEVDEPSFARREASFESRASAAPAPRREPPPVATAIAEREAAPIPRDVLDRAFAVKRWTPATLERLGIGWNGRRFTIPVRDAAGQLVDVLGYLPNAEARGERKMLAGSGKGRHLFPAPETIEGDECWVVEGEPDGISGTELGLPVVAVPGAENWRQEFAARFARFRRVVVLGDCDDAGRRFIRAVSVDLALTGTEVRMLDLDPSRDDKHDVGDALAACGSDADRDALRSLLYAAAEHAPTMTPADVAVERAAQSIEGGGLALVAPDAADALATVTATVPAVWGEHPNVVWASCEPLMIAAPPGTGKTTLVQNVLLRRIGVVDEPLFGLRVVPSDRAVVYLSLDRDRQAIRSLRRMTETLPKGRVHWVSDLGRYRPGKSDPSLMAAWAVHHRADTLMIDSLYGFLPSTKDDATLAWFGTMLRELAAAEIEVAILHHFRKRSGEDGSLPMIDRILGGIQFSASAGSIIAIDGEAGDEEVTAHHVKQPAAVCGPWTLRFDHARGAVEAERHLTPIEFLTREGRSSLKAIGEGCNVGTTRPILSKLTKRLERLVADGVLRSEADDYWLADLGPGAEGEAIF